ncbi:hypothetical protein EMPS_03610 [Entomortierella parvispora]|uniref:RING-type domain-containing protein n=1 Tax=Entomortierella parvispora TaxID=205924 RepID=A0A9P3LV16_9FUNG|nr:hypothetical protein EMPS_03610 [Entomortierella parvispora]
MAMPDWTRAPPTIDLTGPPEPPQARAPLTLPTRSVEIIEIDSNDEDSDYGGNSHSNNNNYISSGDDSDGDGDDVLFVRENPAQPGPSSLHDYFNWGRVPVMPRAPRPQRIEENEYVTRRHDRNGRREELENPFGTDDDTDIRGHPEASRNHDPMLAEATARARAARRASHSVDAQIAAAIASGGRVQHHHHHHHHVVRPHPYNNSMHDEQAPPQQQRQQQQRNRQRQRRGPLRVLDDAILGMLGLVGVGQLSAFDQFVRARDERRIRQRSESMFRDDPNDEIDFYRLHQEMEDRAQAVAAEARAAAAASRPDTTDELEPGFTKALTVDTVVICPACQLPFGHSGVETAELWVIWGCGHVICGDCVDSLFITKTEIKPNQDTKVSPSKNGRGKGRAKNKGSAKSAISAPAVGDGGTDADASERDPTKDEEPEAENLFKITKKQYGNCPCCNRKVKRSSIVRLYH